MPEPEPLQLHALLWSWSAVWPVVAALPDVACEPALLPCVTEPSLPGLSTRTGRLALDAPACAAAESASESWSVPACCCGGLDARARRRLIRGLRRAGLVAGGRRGSPRCSTARRCRRHRGSGRGSRCWCCSGRPASRWTQPRPAAASSPTGRTPGCSQGRPRRRRQEQGTRPSSARARESTFSSLLLTRGPGYGDCRSPRGHEPGTSRAERAGRRSVCDGPAAWPEGCCSAKRRRGTQRAGQGDRQRGRTAAVGRTHRMRRRRRGWREGTGRCGGPGRGPEVPPAERCAGFVVWRGCVLLDWATTTRAKPATGTPPARVPDAHGGVPVKHRTAPPRPALLLPAGCGGSVVDLARGGRSRRSQRGQRRDHACELPLHVDGRRRRDRRHREDRHGRNDHRQRWRHRRPSAAAAATAASPRGSGFDRGGARGRKVRLGHVTVVPRAGDADRNGDVALHADRGDCGRCRSSAGAVPLPVPDPDRRPAPVEQGPREPSSNRSSNSSSRSRRPAGCSAAYSPARA